jgi:Zn-dependent protease
VIADGRPTPIRQCPSCSTEVAPTLLACPACHTLLHGARLKQLSAAADTAQRERRIADALDLLQQALTLLPGGSRQHTVIQERVSALLRAQAAPDTAPPRLDFSSRKGLWTTAALVLTFVLTKGKLLLLGLTKGSTIFSMLASVGVYWAAFGLWYAVGLIGSIYVHEIGHVAALRRYGIPATAPMFIPGFGAFIRVKQMPASLGEQARVGLAGPLWGLFAALGSAMVYIVTGEGVWAAIARTGAWLNIFNLTPVWQLDGSRGFVALSRMQRWLLIAAIALLWYATDEGLLLLVLLVAAGRTFLEAPPAKSDHGVLALFVFLLAALAAVSAVVPALGR